MRNVLLEQTVAFIYRFLILMALYLLWRGHNEPGGGFIAGIIAAIGNIFYAIVFGAGRARDKMIAQPFTFIGTGLLVSVGAAFLPVIQGLSPLTGLWLEIPLWGTQTLHLGSPLLFDIGVFCVVFGMITAIVLTIMEVMEWN